MKNAVLTRQAVFDNKVNTIGYELIFADTQAEVNESEEKLSLEGLQKVVGKQLAFVNCQDIIDKLDFENSELSQQLVLGITDEVAQDKEMMDKLMTLRELGHPFVLSKYTKDSLDKFLDLVNYVVIDMLAYDLEELDKIVKEIKQKNKLLLVRQIENHASFDLCSDLQFDYFQGDFIIQPNAKKEKGEQHNEMMILELVSKLQNPEVKVEEIEWAIEKDARLAYKLLKVVNSPMCGLTRTVSSLREAVIYLGLQQIKRWVSLLALSNVEGVPQELTMTALVRAKMCEVVAYKAEREDAGSYFIVGLFSTLDALLGQSMDELLETITIDDNLKQALLHYEGPMGDTLKKVIAYERADWQAFDDCGDAYQIYSEAYLESICWAESYNHSVSSD